MLSGIAWALATASSIPADDLAAMRLRCEHLENPQGIDARNPRLIWVVTSGQRDEHQTAYHILVASSESLLQQNQGDLWDSGKVLSNQSVHVEYQGRPLVSGMQCFWKVRLWGTKMAESPWSEPASWTMGLLNEREWQAAEWIGEERRAWGSAAEGYFWIWSPESSPQAMAQPAERYFRRQFTVPTDKQIASAVIHITCDNGFVLFLNGTETCRSDDWTRPTAVDIKQHLRAGENTLAIHATNINSATGLTGKLIVQFAYGESLPVLFDQSFKAFNQEVAGWNQVEFDDAAWPAAQVLGPMGMAPWGVIRWPGGEPQYTLPPEKAAIAVEHLAKDITENSHLQTFADALGKNPVIPPGHLTTGFHGSRALLPALTRNGRNDVAYALLLQDTYPSWLYNVKNGATTIWERWDSWMPDQGFQNPAMNSFNMPNIGASIGEWLFSCVGGIDTVGVGFETIRIAPQPGDGLTSASAKYHSIRGMIAVRWEKTSNGLLLDVSIPSNCAAVVRVPIPHTISQAITEGDTLVWAQGRQVNKVDGIGMARLVDEHVEIPTGGGTYRFRIADQR